MPYRKLPNTDKSRLEAMKIALERQNLEPILPIQFKMQLDDANHNFENKLNFKNATLLHAAERNKKHAEIVAKCRMYLSHFYQVINMTILRGELPRKTRNYYGIKETNNDLPNFLNSETKLLEWGEQLIQGEQKRMSEGGIRITNPSLALVSINFENFKDSLRSINMQRNIQDRALTDIITYRDTIDEHILTLWNWLEKHFNSKTKQGREECANWGVNYIYKKSELRRMEQEKYVQSISLSLNLV